MTDGTRWPANIAGQPWAHVTDVSATKKTPQTHGIAAYRSLHSNPTPPLHQGRHQVKEPCVRFDSGSQKRGATPYAAGVRPFT